MRSLRIHWQAPTVIVLSFFVSLALPVGHHLFYASLDHIPVEDNAFSQLTNIAIGTGFAFLFRACLAIATCTAYWQVFWHTALRKTLTISSADALTGVLGSLVEFTHVRTFFFNPGLAALATLAWLVPFASLLPPATLSILPTTVVSNRLERVPVPYFDNVGITGTNYRVLAGDSKMGLKSSIVDMYLQPTLHLSRMVATTAYRGTVPEHETLHLNATYDVAFNAPAIQCLPISQDILKPFNQAAGCDFLGTFATLNPANDSCENQVPYIAWVPEYGALVPFENKNLSSQLLPLDSDLSDLDPTGEPNRNYIGGSTDGPATLFVATRSQTPPYTDWNVLNCSMYNATYVVNISSDSNSRSLPRVSEVRMENSFAYSAQAPRYVDEEISTSSLSRFSYLGMMECLNRLLVGTMVGSSAIGNTSYWLQLGLRVQNPHLMSTLLAFTHELSPFLATSNSSGLMMSTPDSSQWIAVDKSGYNIISLPEEAISSPSFNTSLGSAIEELFQNMTLSLFSDSRFIREQQDPVDVTISYTRNLYSYSQQNLIISYGVALSLALLASIAGCIAIFWNGASYTQKFSTVLRTTTSLGQVVPEKDRSGADPLPEYLSRARAELGRAEETAMEMKRVSERRDERSAMIDSREDWTKEPGIVHQRTLSGEI
ncbi:hypothetical protein Q7P35_001395 [Cladosporium inversicolor]